jgi:methionyl aminopeptidase
VAIQLKSAAEIAKMRAAAQVVIQVLDAVEAACVPGTTTQALNDLALRVLQKEGATSAFLGYGPGGAPPYPAVLCTSVNSEVVHGIPRKTRVLREGDIIGVDFACYKEGYCADAARTVPVGNVSAEARRLIDATRESLEQAIAQCQAGNRLQDIGWAVQEYAERNGYTVVRRLGGHGIGQRMHEEPHVSNFGTAGRGLRMRPGLVLAIEPMLNAGLDEVEVLPDGWTVATTDGQLSAHFEHTVAITETGPEVLTRR